jgi:hypothetical protein
VELGGVAPPTSETDELSVVSGGVGVFMGGSLLSHATVPSNRIIHKAKASSFFIFFSFP